MKRVFCILFIWIFFHHFFSWCQLMLAELSLKISWKSNEKLLKQKLCKTLFLLGTDFRPDLQNLCASTYFDIIISILFYRQREGSCYRGPWWEINSRVQILWQNLFNICCHDKTQKISSWGKEVCLSWKSLSLPILLWKV